ncbi:MAG: retroviral-like aspartic protease family protein [Planctomycetes bacterium]|nr:retroviral-like aspartic protease family protein [Planctomycetota bacterium]
METSWPTSRSRRLASAMLGLLGAACVQTSTLPLDDRSCSTVELAGCAVRMLVDTGCEAMIFDPRGVQRLGLATAPRTAPDVTDATGITMPAMGVVTFEGLRFGTLTMSGDAAVLAVPAAWGEGVLGMSALQACCCIFDFRGGVLHVTAGDLGDELAALYRKKVVARLPLVGARSLPVLTVRVDDRVDVPVLVDTGAETTSLPASVVASLGLPSAADPMAAQRRAEAAELQRSLAEQIGPGGKVEVTVSTSPTRTSVGAHGQPVAEAMHLVRRLAIGPFVCRDVVATSSAEGRLGRDVLARVVWMLHGPRRELWLLEPN